MEGISRLSRGSAKRPAAQGVKLVRPVAPGEALTWSDVAVDGVNDTVATRREMERRFAASVEQAAE